ncbi:MAG: DMT family transporter [Hyphomicrobiales bacterium]
MTSDKNVRGILLMVSSMGAFALADTLVKLSTSFMSPAQVLFFLIAGGLILFTLMAKLQGQKLIDRRAIAPFFILRYLAEVAGMVGMVMALANVPLSTIGAITQATPMLVTVGAVLFLREKVSWRRWSSIVVGFVGVLLIVQPGAAGFDIAVLWALLAMIALSVRDLTTRMVPSNIGSATLATYTMAAAVPFTIGWVLFNGENLFPVNVNWLIVIPMICLGSLGYMLLIASLRMAEVSVVMPFRYSRIIFLLVLGILVFQERPSVSMLLGATLIVVSGVYMMWREQRVKLSANMA